MSDDDDDLLAQLEAELPDEEDDYLFNCDLCMSSDELVTKAQKGETSLGLISASDMSNEECAKFLQAVLKNAKQVEVISLEAVELSQGALGKLLEVVAEKLGNLKALNLSSVQLPEQVYTRFVQYIASNRTLKQLHLSHGENLNLQIAKQLVLALEKNQTLVDFQLDFDTMSPDLQARIDRVLAANRTRGNAPPQQQQHGAAPAVASDGIAVWVKGPVHFGVAPPDQSGQWTRLTFDPLFIAANQAPTVTAAPQQQQQQQVVVKSVAVSASGPAGGAAVRPVAQSAPAPAQSAPAAATKVTAPAAAAPSKPAFLFQVKAMHSYEAADDDEVSFNTGDIIQVLKVVDEDWYIGRVERTGKRGQVPINHTAKQ